MYPPAGLERGPGNYYIIQRNLDTARERASPTCPGKGTRGHEGEFDYGLRGGRDGRTYKEGGKSGKIPGDIWYVLRRVPTFPTPF